VPDVGTLIAVPLDNRTAVMLEVAAHWYGMRWDRTVELVIALGRPRHGTQEESARRTFNGPTPQSRARCAYCHREAPNAVLDPHCTAEGHVYCDWVDNVPTPEKFLGLDVKHVDQIFKKKAP